MNHQRKRRVVLASVAIALIPLAGAVSSGFSPAVPIAWRLQEPGQTRYRLRSDASDVWSGSYSALLEPIGPPDKQANPFAWQIVDAKPFQKSRVRLTAFLKLHEVSNGAYLAMRAEDRTGTVVAFDDMAGHWATGTAGWRQYTLVLDVPETANVLIFGFSIVGDGAVHADDVSLEKVDKTVPLTGSVFVAASMKQTFDRGMVLVEPENLDFELATPGSE